MYHTSVREARSSQVPGWAATAESGGVWSLVVIRSLQTGKHPRGVRAGKTTKHCRGYSPMILNATAQVGWSLANPAQSLDVKSTAGASARLAHTNGLEEEY